MDQVEEASRIEKKRKEGRVRGVKQVVRSEMKKREDVPKGRVGERFVPKRSIEEERLLERCNVEKEVLREDTGEGISRVVENEV